ncbi:2,3-bisphosphoglycerate-independent phosphoglycerate mutase [Engelhardtia mirabilis]|uniref:2,3-bisphosphoglycerate-independent phosphoglycerate mutase n=1 Tax=Engelhardtia mirabilis TaxID=2528011 RepID=A0A518BQM7_9BACT|nr:2,3-bisphosphoglycerate-independent phosphoglycerate mutase [Planctomycetes bacterium Pla133]QDV03609.1 2,3-bisphosphoglycerate-independent phosphoglycerate mutase [Planctomycetes bacterium Pla86]
MNTRPLLLIVLDGWGHREAAEHNVIRACSPYYHELLGKYPHTLLSASGEEVGLPLGLMGNSEVGHMNLGAGRVVYQDITRIDKSIRDGEFAGMGALARAFELARSENRTLHLMGLVSDGGVHSSDGHLRALLNAAAARGLAPEQVCVHAITDGRDTPPRSGADFIAALEQDIERAGVGRIASVIGRYWAMDRDQRWERVKRAYDLFVGGVGLRVDRAAQALGASYEADTSDEFLEPFVVGDPDRGRIGDGDPVICFNFRSDRMREICAALGLDSFDGFERTPRVRPLLTTMTQYRADFPFAIVYPPRELTGTFPDLVSEAGLTQLRLAETEKYAHVSFFFSGGREAELPGERRILVPSPKVATYDLQPQMSAPQVCDRLLDSLERDETDVYIVNFANADMVGHTGIEAAACAAVTAVDECLRRIVPKVVERGGMVAITADHGNAEMMWDELTHQPHTAHTTNPVPIVLCGTDLLGARLRPMGILADVAPTLLELAGLRPSAGMDGVSLFDR